MCLILLTTSIVNYNWCKLAKLRLCGYFCTCQNGYFVVLFECNIHYQYVGFKKIF